MKNINPKFKSLFITMLVCLSLFSLIGCGSGSEPPTTTPNETSSERAADEIVFKDIQLSTGVTLNYAEQGKADGQVVILLHGYLDSWYSFSDVLPHLSTDYHIYALTQRGHGDSDKPTEPESYSGEKYAADVTAFMDDLNIENAIVVGHSMGSFIAQGVALNNPERVTKLVLIGTGATGDNEVLYEFLDAVQDFEDPVDRDFVDELQSSTVVRPVPEFMKGIVDESMKVPALVWKEALIGLIETDYSQDLNQITVPTLVIWGDHDEIFLKADQDAVMALIPNATFKPYTDTGHSPNWEIPEVVAQDLTAFFEEGK